MLRRARGVIGRSLVLRACEWPSTAGGVRGAPGVACAAAVGARVVAAGVVHARQQERRAAADVIRAAALVARKESVAVAWVVAAGLAGRAWRDCRAAAAAAAAARRLAVDVAAAGVSGGARRHERRAAAGEVSRAPRMAGLRAVGARVIAARVAGRAPRRSRHAAARVVRGAAEVAGGALRRAVVLTAHVVRRAANRELQRIVWVLRVQGGRGAVGPLPGGLVVAGGHDAAQEAVLHVGELAVEHRECSDATAIEVGGGIGREGRAADGEGVGRGVCEHRQRAVARVLRELLIDLLGAPIDNRRQAWPVSCRVRLRTWAQW